MDKISFWSAFSIQMARSFSEAYENSVMPAILVGLLIVCHPPGAICQAPFVPEPCVEALPRAPTSLTPSYHLSRLSLSLHHTCSFKPLGKNSPVLLILLSLSCHVSLWEPPQDVILLCNFCQALKGTISLDFILFFSFSVLKA